MGMMVRMACWPGAGGTGRRDAANQVIAESASAPIAIAAAERQRIRSRTSSDGLSGTGHIGAAAYPPQHRGQVRCRLPPVLRVTLEAASNRPVQVCRIRRLNVPDGQRLAGQDAGDDGGAVRTVERTAAGGHLVEHQPARKQVRPGVALLALDLFRRHVLQGSHHLSDVRQGAVGDGVAFEQGGAEPGEAEVQQFRAPLREHDVGGLHVTVHDAGGVRMLEAADDLDAVDEQLLERKRAARQSRRQRFAVEVLHDDEVEAAFDADVVDRADVGMAQRGDGSGLAFEARARLFAVVQRGGEDLIATVRVSRVSRAR